MAANATADPPKPKRKERQYDESNVRGCLLNMLNQYVVGVEPDGAWKQDAVARVVRVLP